MNIIWPYSTIEITCYEIISYSILNHALPNISEPCMIGPRWCKLGGCLLQRMNVLLGPKDWIVILNWPWKLHALRLFLFQSLHNKPEAAVAEAPRWCRLGGCLLQRNNVLLGRKVGWYLLSSSTVHKRPCYISASAIAGCGNNSSFSFVAPTAPLWSKIHNLIRKSRYLFRTS